MQSLRPPEHDNSLEDRLAALLRLGVLLAVAVILAGALVFLTRHSWDTVDPARFQAEPSPYRGPVSMLKGVFALRGQALIELGVFLLVLTPVARVAASAAAFARARDWRYALIASFVLITLLASLFAAFSE